MDMFTQGLRLDPGASLAATQHAIAGKAAVGLVQATEANSHTIHPSEDVLQHVADLNQFAQRAELTRKILERYLIGTEVNRIDPVYVPVSPGVISSYPVPAQDASVFKAEHLPYNVNIPSLATSSVGAIPLWLLPRNCRANSFI